MPRPSPLPGRELERNEACRPNPPERPPGCVSPPRFDRNPDLLPLAHAGLVDRQEVRSGPTGTGRRPQLGGRAAWLARPHRQAGLAAAMDVVPTLLPQADPTPRMRGQSGDPL